MNESEIRAMRYIFSRFEVHPAWDTNKREALADLFDLDEEDIDLLHKFCMWVASHGLEYAFEAYEAQKGASR